MHNGNEIGSGAPVTKEYRPWTPEQGFLDDARAGRTLCHNLLELYRAAPRLASA